jgi:hypothetical protein
MHPTDESLSVSVQGLLRRVIGNVRPLNSGKISAAKITLGLEVKENVVAEVMGMKQTLKTFLHSAVLSGIFALLFIGIIGSFPGNGYSAEMIVANRGVAVLSFGLGVIAGAILLKDSTS